MNRSPMPRPDPAKLRAWRERSKGLKHGKGPERRKAMAQVNAARRRKQYERNFGERADHARAMVCLVWWRKLVGKLPLDCGTPCFGTTQAAHVVARGMGGANGNRRKIINLCAGHHTEAGEYRTTQRAEFERRYGVDLQSEADDLAERFDAQGLP